MKENFPNLAKEIDFQEVQEAQRVPEKLDPRRNTLRDIIITSPMIKDEEKILKAADFSKETLQARRKYLLERSIPRHERQGPTSKIALTSKAII